jgi:hypothetical protein
MRDISDCLTILEEHGDQSHGDGAAWFSEWMIPLYLWKEFFFVGLSFSRDFNLNDAKHF